MTGLLKGKIKKIIPDGVNSGVIIQTAGGTEVVSIITKT